MAGVSVATPPPLTRDGGRRNLCPLGLEVAGYAFPSLFLETPEQQFRNEIDVNYLGTVWPAQVRRRDRSGIVWALASSPIQHAVGVPGTVPDCAQECVRIMLEHKIKGELIFVSSIMATTAFAGYSAYCASKWAVRGASLRGLPASRAHEP